MYIDVNTNEIICGYVEITPSPIDQKYKVPADLEAFIKNNIGILEGNHFNGFNNIKDQVNTETVNKNALSIAQKREKEWRLLLLSHTDFYVQTTDFPLTETQRQSLLDYRQALRDWPEHSDFPNTEHRPVPDPSITQFTTLPELT